MAAVRAESTRSVRSITSHKRVSTRPIAPERVVSCDDGWPALGICGTGFARVNAGSGSFAPRGVNSYVLLQHAGAERFDQIDDIFAQARALGRPIVRTPAFLDAGDSPARLRDARGAPREQGMVVLDRLLDAAANSRIRLLLVLANNWRDFGGAPAILELIAPDEKLPKNAFWTDPRALDNQLAYQHALASRTNSVNGARYADDPTICAWELANEARCESDGSGRTLAAWARRMSDGLRAAGVKQPIAWGGSGYLGKYGENLRLIAADGGVDVLTLHMYGSMLRTRRVEKVIAWGVDTLRERSAVARSAGLPLLLEEVNWKPPEPGDDAQRARVLGAWLAEAEALSVGSLPWMIGERGRNDYDGYLIRPEHAHTLAALRAHEPSS